MVSLPPTAVGNDCAAHAAREMISITFSLSTVRRGIRGQTADAAVASRTALSPWAAAHGTQGDALFRAGASV